MTLGLEGRDVHRNAGSESKLIAVKSSSGAWICNLPPILPSSLPDKIFNLPPRENCSSTLFSVSPGRLIVGRRRGVKWAGGIFLGWEDIFGLHKGDISGRGLERNGSAAEADK